VENLQKEGVQTAAATIVEGETSSFSIILNIPCGERVILYATGINAHLNDATFDRDAMASRDWIYFNHMHAESSSAIQRDILDIVRTHPATGLTWNPGGRQLEHGLQSRKNRDLLQETDLLLLNKEEALVFTGEQTAEKAMRALLSAGAKIVCISDGPSGSDASDGTHFYHCGTVQDAVVVDATGAGDAFGTGMTWALLRGFDLPTMLRAGTINATSVLAAIGAESGLLTDIQMQTTLRDRTLDVVEKPF
jgi:sugar/nucleoside kinase (ribokinase family)